MDIISPNRLLRTDSLFAHKFAVRMLNGGITCYSSVHNVECPEERLHDKLHIRDKKVYIKHKKR